MKKFIAQFSLFFLSAGTASAACLPADLCARVTGLSDINFGNYSFTGDFTTNNDFCVFVQNDDDSNYELTGSGSGSSDEFEVSYASFTIPMTVEITDLDGAPAYSTLVENNATTFTPPNTTDETCAVGGNSTNVRITLDEADLQPATAGTYTGTVTISVSPD